MVERGVSQKALAILIRRAAASTAAARKTEQQQLAETAESVHKHRAPSA